MSTRLRTPIIIAVALYIGLHFSTLDISPLPWFDEVVFADIAKNYAERGKMEMTVMPLYYSGFIYQYGPVYFVLQALIIKIFGMSAMSFRALNLICGFGVVAIVCSIFKRQSDQPTMTWLLASLILLDTIFNQNLHSGRMDLVAVFFVTCSLFFAYHFRNERRFYQVVMVGIFAAFAFLTTPRSMFLLPIPASFLLFKPDKSVFRNAGIAATCFIVPVLAIIQISVGVSNYFEGMTSNGGGMPQFIGGSLFRESYENHVILTMIVTAAIFYKKIIQSPLLISLVIGFGSFSLFVKEAGPYSAMIMPFIYFVIVAVVAEENNKVRYGVILFLLTINLGIFSIKALTIATSAKQRNINSGLYSKLKSIPTGSRILSDYRMYYWALDHHDTVETYVHYRTSDERYIVHIINEFVPDYVIVGPGDKRRKIFTSPDFVRNYEMIDSIALNDAPKSNLQKLINHAVSFETNFECLIYKRTVQPR